MLMLWKAPSRCLCACAGARHPECVPLEAFGTSSNIAAMSSGAIRHTTAGPKMQNYCDVLGSYANA